MDEMRNRILRAQEEETGQWSYELTEIMSPDLLLKGENVLVNTEQDADVREEKRDFFVEFMIAVIRHSVDFGYRKCIEHMSY